MTIPNLGNQNPDPQQVLNPQNNYNPTNPSLDQSQSQTQQTLNSGNQTGAPSDLTAFAQELAALRQQNQQMFQMITSGGFGNNQNHQVQQPRHVQQLPEVPEITKDQFWENPAQSTRQLVENLMTRALAPINQNIATFVNQQQYQAAKQQMKIMPQYNMLVRMEHIFDNVVNNAINSGIPLTDGLLTTSYYTALGIAMQNGTLNQPTPQNNQQNSNAMVLNNQQPPAFQQQFNQQNQPIPQQQNQNNLITPPYLSNGNTQQQQQNNTVRFRPLEENEEVLRRKNGMSVAEFLFYGNEIGEEVFKAADPQGHARYVNPSGRK